MSDACCGDAPARAEVGAQEEVEQPWWRDRAVVLPILSGVFLAAGLLVEWLAGTPAARIVALVLFWLGLLAGASTFVPGALRNLVRKRKLGIGLLMTISAVGAVILGYVEEAAALAFLYSLAEMLEDKAMDRARSGLRALLKLVPETATVARGGRTVTIPARELTIGQLMLVRPGERVATDGVVRSGRSSLDTSAITGESIPVEVEAGDPVSAGSINTSGVLEVEATAAGTDNSLTTIVELVEQAQAEKGDRARLADRIARPLVPGVLVLALLVAVVGSLFGDPELWITRALVVLVAASPCALAISVPVTVVSAIGAASKFGVIIKSGAAFERLGSIRHAAMDKTGTLTPNQPVVTAVVTTEGWSESDVLSHAAALERQSTHPLALAIVAAASDAPASVHVEETAGHGVLGTVEGRRVTVGSPRWIDAGQLADRVEQLEGEGRTCVLVTVDGETVGVIGVRDELRPEVPEVVATLADQGVGVSMLTGDNARTAAALGRDAGIADVRAELRPEDKAGIVAELDERVPTAMIGDGINDAPALAGATVGIAMGATGSDAAIESADVAFTGHDLRLIPQALAHARRGGRIINQNIVLSLAIIIVLLPLAITGVLGLAAVVLVHEVAEVVVIANGLRAAQTKRTELTPIGPGGSARAADDLAVATA
ncbi:cation-translocating P-type ATPase [Propioniciclava sp. MC1595]|uniref:heavy metal translocating P-type ATPase n=1 Tax=Propioniciclava sp. MC1595 TaxID=2760308 RepID=UPI00166246E6|nr:cation-translocating P-type ATPase [Propioniciclava sp. MC1595]MBB1496320.1 cation-translocating P-type ATPase [Propioniciclava sp. MC1595]QTE26274.1 cation-translocating P-type ATPase [Propioniciclava sp. MC1595]